MRGNPFLEVSLTHAAPQDHSESLKAAMAASHWRRPDLRLAQGTSDAKPSHGPQDSDNWSDPLLTEIEDLVAELKAKVARYSLLKSDPSLTDPSHPDNRTATEWMHEALEDIAATALGIELASQERMFRALPVVEQGTTVDTNHERQSGTAG